MRVLFVCSRNQWRSPTAERLWRRAGDLQVRSAGTSRHARRRVTAGDLQWADVVVCMEDHHADRIRATFGRLARSVAIEVLGIPDEHRFMAPALVAELEAVVPPVLERHRR